MEKLEIFLLEETMGVVPEYWGLNQFANFNYSNVMKSLYLYDFPNAWKEGELKKKICTIGANDYFNKWTSEEFLVIEDSGLNGIFSLANEELVKGSIVNGKRTGIPLFGGNHQLLFYNTTLQVFKKKISYRTFRCIISLRQPLQRKVIPYDKLIIQQRKPDW